MSNSEKSSREQKVLSQERFGKVAVSYVTSQTHARGEDLKMLFEMANPQPDWHVLDIATGGGHTALLFAPAVKSVVASDIGEKMLDSAKAFIEGKGIKNVSFQQAESDNLPFENESFNLVTCRIAPHHFPNCLDYIKDATRVLKKGGFLLMQDHCLPDNEQDGVYVDDFERLRDPSHNHAHSKAGWINLFEACRLQVVETREVIKRHELIPWADRQKCSVETKQELQRRLKNASPGVKSWIQPLDLDGDNPSFVNHHLLILGQKGE